MFSVPRFIGGLAAAGLTAIVAMPSAHAVGNVGYSDQMCQAFYADPNSPPPTQVLRCAKLLCTVSTNVSYIQPVGTPVTMTVTCVNPPPGLTYRWVKSAQNGSTCPPVPAAPADAANNITVASNAAQVCWYEAIATDTANPPNTGWVRYGLKWQ